MDYEKKYNEALERARNLYPGVHSHNKAMLEQIFPELRESEDEMIRNWLLVQLETNYKGNYWAEKAVAYLKKQEQKPISQEDFDAAKHEVLWDEQKPAWSEEDEEMLDAVIDIVSGSFYEPLCPRKEMLAWLKSLPMRCPKSSDNWKPSKKQLDALNFAITYFIHDTSYKNPTELRELYEQLRKLL